VSAAPLDIEDQVRERLLAPLAGLRRRCRLYVALDGLLALFLSFVVAGAVQLVLDRWLRMSYDQRATINVLITIVWGLVAVRRLARPLADPLADYLLATVVDRANPDLRDRLAAAVQFSELPYDARSNSPQLVRAVLADACAAAPDVAFLRVLNHRRAARQLGAIGALVVAVGIAWSLQPGLMNAWFQRNWLLRETPWPQRTHILPEGFDEFGVQRVPRGDSVEIVARNQGRVPTSVELRWTSGDSPETREPMTQVGRDQWRAGLGVMRDEIELYIVGGDEWTRTYRVVPVDRPRIVASAVHVEPPAYTGLAPMTYQGQTTIELPQGSRLTIEGRLNKRVRAAQFVGREGAVGEVDVSDPRRVSVSWDEPRSGAYWFALRDRDGVENSRPAQYLLQVRNDQAPQLELRLAEPGASITPAAVLPLRVECRDDFGIGRILVQLRRGQEPAFDVPFELSPVGVTIVEQSLSVELRSLVALRPDDRVMLTAEAADLDPRGPNVGQARPIELVVRSPAEFQAEMARRELELRRDFEQLITAQRGVRDALERLRGELAPGVEPDAARRQQLATLSRRQESHADRALAIRREFERVLARMRANRVSGPADERRIAEAIGAPLGALGERSMPDAAEKISSLRERVDGEALERVPVAQEEILRSMNLILAGMLQSEGYREAVALLREIIEQQGETHDATLAAVERELQALLGLDDLPADAPPRRPEP